MSKLNILEALRRTVRHVFNHVAEVDATSRKWVEERISEVEFTEEDKADLIQTIEDESIGDIEAALLNIIAIQEELMIPNGDEVEY